MKKWNELLKNFSNPINRLEKYLISKKIISKTFQSEVREKAK